MLTDVVHAEKEGKSVAKKPTRTQREEALDLMQKGRTQLAENKLDDATKSAMQAKVLIVKWGLFEDTPDALVAAIEKVRADHNQDESLKVLAEGRRLLEQKDFDGASRAALRRERYALLISGTSATDRKT